MAVTNKPHIEAYVGTTGSGKGVSIKEKLDELGHLPLLIWDPRDEYQDYAPVNMDGFTRAAQQIRAGKCPKVRFVHDGKSPIAEAFATVCAVVFWAGNCVFLAEELSDVTTASLAPPEWKRIITQGRHQGLVVIGAAQRPALIDKTFLGNTTYIRCFSLRYDDDRKAMAKAMDVPKDRIDALATTDDELEGKPVITTVIRWVEVDFRRRLVQDGHKTLTMKRPKG